MAYKQKGCTPITAKIQKGTKGGIVAPLLKAMGVPMKVSPLKETGYEKKARKQGKTVEQIKKEAGPTIVDRFLYNASSEGQAANRVKREKMLNDKKEAHLKSQGKGKKSATTSSNTKIGKGAGATVKSEKNTEKTYNPKKMEDVKGVGSKYRAKKPKAKVLDNKVKTQEVKKPKVSAKKSLETKTPEIKITPKVVKTKKEVRVETRKLNKSNRQETRQENRSNRQETRQENRDNRRNKRIANRTARRAKR